MTSRADDAIELPGPGVICYVVAMGAWAGLLLFWGLCGGPWVAAAQAWGVRPDGSRLAELASPGSTRVIVLFFVATDCPVSNRTFPEMRRVREEFKGRGVSTWFVYPNTYEKPADIQAHQRAFDAGGEALMDPSGDLLRLTHAVATPEIAVLVPNVDGWRVAYTGRIDNRYVRLGLERPAATEHYGEDSVAAALAGRTPKAPVGAPVGCAIVHPGSK